MAWFKVDDNLAFHAKTIRAGNAAMGLWVRAGSWAAQQLTDGHIPMDVVLNMGSKRDAQRLVDAGLWVQNGDGYQFHQWGERQPTAAEVLERRKKGAERLAHWRADRGL